MIEVACPFTIQPIDRPMGRDPGRWATRALGGDHPRKKRWPLSRIFARPIRRRRSSSWGITIRSTSTGVAGFLAKAKEAGVDGLIVVDLPPEEDAELCLPALAAGAQFHPARDADDRRGAACPPSSPIRRALSIMFQSPALPARRPRIYPRSPPPLSESSSIHSLRSPLDSASRTPNPPRPSPPTRMAWWWARRWSRPCEFSLDAHGKATSKSVETVTALVADIAKAFERRRPWAAEAVAETYSNQNCARKQDRR